MRSRAAVRSLYLRGIGLCHLVAHVSLWVQLEALIGDDGIVPVRSLVPWLAENGSAWTSPTLLWLWPTPAAAHALCAVGALAGLGLLAGVPVEGWLLVVAWTTYLSLCTVGDLFLGFQWDSLLVEATFVAAFVARWTPRQPLPPTWTYAVQAWLLFRLVLLAGIVKLSSGDPTWANFTALDYHFWTQPLPNPLSRWAHHLPAAVHAAGVGLTFAVELVAPVAMVFGRVPRAIAAGAIALLMALLAVSGNYGFFQVLTVVLCLPLLDDDLLPESVVRVLVREPPSIGGPRWPTAAIAGAWVGVSSLWFVGYRDLPRPAQRVLEVTAPFRSANPYGLFAVMTTDRVEIVFEGSWDDGATWRELDLRYKPGPVDAVPPQVAPHMPRIAWQLWFAGLSTCADNPWVVRLMERVVEGSPAVMGQFSVGTFDDGPPDRVRALGYRYTFSSPGSDAVWTRTRLGRYCADEVGH